MVLLTLVVGGLAIAILSVDGLRCSLLGLFEDTTTSDLKSQSSQSGQSV